MAVRISLFSAVAIILLLFWVQPGPSPPQPSSSPQRVDAVELRDDQILKGPDAAKLSMQAFPQDREALRDGMATKMLRLPLDAFPKLLPDAVKRILSARQCQVPQPDSFDGRPRNLIRGGFFGTTEMGWAVYCSSGSTTSLLVVSENETRQVQVLSSTADREAVQWADGSDQAWFGSELSVATPEYITTHWKYYGTGPLPFAIEHDGVNVGILDKASTVQYLRGGQWHTLPGSD